jgi:hypothetical protein
MALLVCTLGCRDISRGPLDAAAAPDANDLPSLCVFDYDLTLSSNSCEFTADQPGFFCRVNSCSTYGWYQQCLGQSARTAIAECVARGAFIGIASHADVDACWADKVTPIIDEQQFPEWTGAPRYVRTDLDWHYPPIDDRSQWNCDDCAYHMDGSLPKAEGISRIMRHYRLDPSSAADQRRVLFWDDEPYNIDSVTPSLPGVHAILVPRNGLTGAEGGCGIGTADIARGWASASSR